MTMLQFVGICVIARVSVGNIISIATQGIFNEYNDVFRTCIPPKVFINCLSDKMALDAEVLESEHDINTDVFDAIETEK